MTRYNSEQMLAMLMEQTAHMSENDAAHAVIVEGAPNDDALLGGLFRLAVLGRLSEAAYEPIYAATNRYGYFTTNRMRLVAVRMVKAFR